MTRVWSFCDHIGCMWKGMVGHSLGHMGFYWTLQLPLTLTFLPTRDTDVNHTRDLYWRYTKCTIFLLPHSQCTSGTSKFTEYKNLYSISNFSLNAAIFLLFSHRRHLKTSLVLDMWPTDTCVVYTNCCVWTANFLALNPYQNTPLDSLNCF